MYVQYHSQLNRTTSTLEKKLPFHLDWLSKTLRNCPSINVYQWIEQYSFSYQSFMTTAALEIKINRSRYQTDTISKRETTSDCLNGNVLSIHPTRIRNDT